MDKEEFSKLTGLDKVKYCVEESLKEHKDYNTQFWKGSAYMGESILKVIEDVKQFEPPTN